jgi:hypothetical protein
MGRHQQVHGRRATGQFLFPERYLVPRGGTRDQHDQLGRLSCEPLGGLDLKPARLGIVTTIGRLKQGCEGIALLAGDSDETPGMKLAMIGRARGNRQNLLEFISRRPRLNEIARPSRAATPSEGARSHRRARRFSFAYTPPSLPGIERSAGYAAGV